jgi:hypothetical protein
MHDRFIAANVETECRPSLHGVISRGEQRDLPASDALPRNLNSGAKLRSVEVKVAPDESIFSISSASVTNLRPDEWPQVNGGSTIATSAGCTSSLS